MEKQKRNMILFVTLTLIISVTLLLVVYKYDLCYLVENALVAAYTGCILAIPSGYLIIKGERKRIINEQAELLDNLYTLFENFSISSDYNSYRPSDVEKIRRHIVKLYYALGKIVTENYLWKSEQEKIEKLLNKIFDFSISIIDLKLKYREIDEEKYTKDVQKIYEKKNMCLSLIKELQKEQY